MVDLFRYVEHDFALPAATDVIEVVNESDFQVSLGAAARSEGSRQRVRALAEDFLTSTFPSPTTDPTSLGSPLSTLPRRLRKLAPVDLPLVRKAVKKEFGRSASELVAAADFRADEELLQNAVLAVKLVTGFAKADTARLVRQLRAAAFIRELAAGDLPDGLDAARVRSLLARPARIPAELLAATRATPSRQPVPPRPDDEGRQRIEGLRTDRDALQAGYDAVLALPPSRLEVAIEAPAAPADRAVNRREGGEGDRSGEKLASLAPSTLRIGAAAFASLDPASATALSALPVDPLREPLEEVVGVVTRRLKELNAELLPLEAPAPARIFRVGAHLFAERTGLELQPREVLPAAPPPDFSHAVTRPIGVGNLQVVRQELLGYEAGDISHIENVLEGELLRRSTRREEVSELTLTEEAETTQTEERDQQSTNRNELASASHKEAGTQTSSWSEAMIASDYGKLVENSKSNFAQSTTARAVDSLSRRVRRQRVERERKTYVEHAVHELDNQEGSKKVRGIYQWVDKRYGVSVLNYGKRLMYDVVVPEPASFFVQALKDADKPESLQLEKPPEPPRWPSNITPSNYEFYAALFGVTGSVSPPPPEYAKTVAEVKAVELEKVDKDGVHYDVYLDAYKLEVPDGYRAIGGYVQQVNPDRFLPPPDTELELFIGEAYLVRFTPTSALNESFAMAGETGEVPVTARSFQGMIRFNYAIGINCQRTEKAYEEWRLKTHATIVSGYRQQLAEYEDKLDRYVAALRSQLALADNYAHDPAVEQQELKKAFIYLLLGEHPGAAAPTPEPAPIPPAALPPDPAAVRDWGAKVAFFERAFEWDNLMYSFYPYFWGRPQRWSEAILAQDANPRFEAFLKAGAARVVVPVRPGFEAALAHFHETGDVWMGEEIPDMLGDEYVSIIAEIKAANRAPGEEALVDHWEVTLPTTLVLLKGDAALPKWKPTLAGAAPDP
jgi:hypothetical protein